ncbi:MT-A70 family methyltransferase [Sinorhizobium meliloti]|uniref:MT-A70 family methyltransferase n=1 Tax=Rhizobium meliloti TaxID=382 RepID=UPI001F1CAC21|nr:MT-A70 family methyltransferase [Sinorhizobium meliloti]
MTDWFFDPLLPLHYEMMVIDIRCPFDLYSDAGAKKSASAHYDVMSAEQIRALPVGQLASMNCLIYTWATAPQLPFAVECLKAWGFEYKSFMAWRKTTAAGKVRMGSGYRVRTTGEIVLVGTLGNPKQSHVPPTIFAGIAREHSREPEAFYDLCDRVMTHARRADVFAREQRSGWRAFGNEVSKFDPEVAA